MAVDPKDAVVSAVVAYLTTALPTLTVIEGWPDGTFEADHDTAPELAVTAREKSRDDQPLEAVEQTEVDEATLDVLWRYALVTYSVRLDLFARSKAKRREASAAIEAALHNDIPRRAGLYLACPAYEDRPLDLFAETKGDLDDGDDGDGAAPETWRRWWLLDCNSDLVVRATSPRMAAATLAATTYTRTGVDETTGSTSTE